MVELMHEHDVRKLLYQSEIRRIKKEKPDTRVVDEMVLLRGAARIDVAVINDALHGYEIKSCLDNLHRLPDQQSAYAKVFERVTLVADERHVEHAVKLVPRCWGLIAIGMKNGKPHADEIWPATRNLELDRLSLAQLLWRDETIELMEYFGLAGGMRSKPKKDLWKCVARNLSVEELKAFVCYKLKTRKEWR
jgi:hypothetical protein